MKKMNRNLLILLLIIAAILFSYFYLESSSGKFQFTYDIIDGETIDIPVYVYDVTNLGSGTIKFEYDTSMLSLESVSVQGNYADNNGVMTVLFHKNEGVSGDTLVCNLKMNCLSTGRTFIEIIYSELLDSKPMGNDIEHHPSNRRWRYGPVIYMPETPDIDINELHISTNSDLCKVTKSPDQNIYEYGTSVVLTAVPYSGYIFTHWSGSISSNDNPTTVVMDGKKVITAHFQEQ